MDESQAPSETENTFEHFGIRDGNLFVVDIAPNMFELNDESEWTYFEECLHAYARILSQKLMWNRRDWMGLMFYNSSKNWDRDPDTKYIFTFQQFVEINAEMFKEICSLLDAKIRKKDWCDPTSDISLDECLHDALWQALRSFDSVKIAMPIRQVVLLTRNDNPLRNNAEERHKLRLRAKTFRDMNVQLRIVGLGKNWNHVLFYKDLTSLANKIELEDAQPIHLKDLESQVKFLAKTCGHMKWKIAGRLEIPVFLASFSSKTKYFKKARMHKDTNEILEVHQHWTTSLEAEIDSEDENDEDIVKNTIPDFVRKAVTCGDRLISFRPEELKDIRMPCEIGITLLGFKPTNADFIYNIKAAKFMGVESSAGKEAKSLFAALFSKCNAKGVMAICAVTHRGAPYLAAMIPCLQFKGFYLSKIPFKEQINNLEDYTRQYIYDIGNGNPPPISNEGVCLLASIIEKLRMDFNPLKFGNPKLNRQLAYIETLALDTERMTSIDLTEPNHENMVELLSEFMSKYEEMFGSPFDNVKRKTSSQSGFGSSEKNTKIDDKAIRDLIKNDKLREMTVVTLKSIARSIGVPSTGLKAELIERITNYKKTDL